MGTAYCFDYLEGIRVLSEKRRGHVSVRVLLDDSQYRKPSCKQQPDSISRLLEWGVEFKTFSPDRGQYAIMHAKTWVIDGSVAVTGSPNFTNNGMEKSEELLTVIRHDGFIADYLVWFERLWQVAEVVTRGSPSDAAASTR